MCIASRLVNILFGFFFVFEGFLANNFLAHCNPIPIWELGIQRLENTLYCTVNNWNNTMKEKKRVGESLS